MNDFEQVDVVSLIAVAGCSGQLAGDAENRVAFGRG